MSEKKEIKCQFCGETFNEEDLIIKTEENRDAPSGWDWGIRRWKTSIIKMCPNCRYPLIVNDKKIDFKRGGNKK